MINWIKQLYISWTNWKKHNACSNYIRGYHKLQGGWVAIAGLAVSAYSAMNSGGGGGSQGGGSQLADPFQSSRGAYANMLNMLMFGDPGKGATPAQEATKGTWVPGFSIPSQSAESGGDATVIPGHYEGAHGYIPGTPGTGARSSLEVLQSIPGYKAGLEQGNQNILAADAASGRTGSGGEKMALQKYGQDYAQSQFTNYANMLAQFSGASWQSGPAAGQLQNQQYAAGQQQQAQGIGGVVSGLSNIYNNYQSQNNPWGGSGFNLGSSQQQYASAIQGYSDPGYVGP